MPWFYHIFYAFVIFLGFIAHLWCRWQVNGKENVPKKGPLIIVANHIHAVDIPLVAINLGRKAAFVAKEELYSPKPLGLFMRSIGTFPVRRGKFDTQSIRKAQKLLSNGIAVAMFPEGTRSKTSQLQSAFSGAVLLALRSDAPILPVGVAGTEQIKGLSSVLKRPMVTINIGRPFHLPPASGKLTKEKRSELTTIMMQHIAELLPSRYHGDYTDKKKHED